MLEKAKTVIRVTNTANASYTDTSDAWSTVSSHTTSSGGRRSPS
jgi:hypothetical protein